MKFVKVGGVLVAVVMLGLGGLLMSFYSKANAKLDKTWDIDAKEIPVPYPLGEAELDALRAERAKAKEAAGEDSTEGSGDADADADGVDPLADVDLDALALQNAIARGKHLMESRAGCFDCHGEDYGGHVVVEAPPMGKWVAPNITKGKGGLPESFGPKDWVRVLRHGVGHDGRTLTMPSLDYTWFSDQEISDLAAFVGSRPLVDREMPPTEIGPIFAMLLATGEMPVSAYEIDHDADRLERAPEAEPTEAFGEHVGAVCTGCHGHGYSGGPIPGGDPAWPPAANITPHADGLGGWSFEDFKKAMSEGTRPDGSAIAAPMPWQAYGKMTDTELEALYKYLQTLPSKPTGGR